MHPLSVVFPSLFASPLRILSSGNLRSAVGDGYDAGRWSCHLVSVRCGAFCGAELPVPASVARALRGPIAAGCLGPRVHAGPGRAVTSHAKDASPLRHFDEGLRIHPTGVDCLQSLHADCAVFGSDDRVKKRAVMVASKVARLGAAVSAVRHSSPARAVTRSAGSQARCERTAVLIFWPFCWHGAQDTERLQPAQKGAVRPWAGCALPCRDTARTPSAGAGTRCLEPLPVPGRRAGVYCPDAQTDGGGGRGRERAGCTRGRRGRTCAAAAAAPGPEPARRFRLPSSQPRHGSPGRERDAPLDQTGGPR